MRISLCLSFLLYAILGFSQISESDLLQKEKNRLENLKNVLLDADGSEFNKSTALELRSMVDADDDGMDDDWELANGLDPTDNRDAWTDKDGDAIKNMFEFQLSTDPNSPLDPVTTNYNPDTDDFNSLIQSGLGSILVLKMSEGVYTSENTTSFAETDSRIMIQGGWNSDFTEHNPDKYITRFVGDGTDEILYLSSLTEAENDLETYILILEGFEIEQGGSTFGNINFITWGVENAVFVVYDVISSNSATHGMTFHHWSGSHGKVFLVNSEFSGNASHGFRNQTTSESTGDWKFYNITLSRNGSDGNPGFRSFTINSEVNLDATNIIAINNLGSSNLNLGDTYTGTIRHSNFVFSDISDTEMTHENSIQQNPQFINPPGGDYTLGNTSPCIDSGVDIGLPFAGSAPDMGAHELGDIMSFNNNIDLAGINFTLVSNLIEQGQDIEVVCDFDQKVRSIQLQIYDAQGRQVKSSALDKRTKRQNISNSFLPGTYLMQVYVNGSLLSAQQFIIF